MISILRTDLPEIISVEGRLSSANRTVASNLFVQVKNQDNGEKKEGITDNQGFFSLLLPGKMGDHLELSAEKTQTIVVVYDSSTEIPTITPGNDHCQKIAITSAPITELFTGQTWTYELGTSNTASYLQIFGPAGLTLENQESVTILTFIPTAEGNYPVTIKVANECSSDVQNFSLNVQPLPRLDPRQSKVELSSSCLTANGAASIQVTVTPLDFDGNLLGPGYILNVFPSQGQIDGPISDNGDGTYHAGIISTVPFENGHVSVSMLIGTAEIFLEQRPSFASKKAAPPSGGMGGCPLNSRLDVWVYGEDGPLESVYVMLGPKEGEPIPANIKQTDSRGHALFEGLNLVGRYPVSAISEGCISASYYQVESADLAFFLEQGNSQPTATNQISMKLTNINPPPGKTFVGFWNSSLRDQNIFHFAPNIYMQDYTTQVILGIPVSIPKNLIITQKKEQDFIVNMVVMDTAQYVYVVGGFLDDTLVSQFLTNKKDMQIESSDILTFFSNLPITKTGITPGIPEGVLELSDIDPQSAPLEKSGLAITHIELKNSDVTDMLISAHNFFPNSDFIVSNFMKDEHQNFFYSSFRFLESDEENSFFIPGQQSIFQGMSYNLLISAQDLSGGSDGYSSRRFFDGNISENISQNQFLEMLTNLKITEKNFSSPTPGLLTFDGVNTTTEEIPPSALHQSLISLIELVPNPDDPDQMILIFRPIWKIVSPISNGKIEFTLPELVREGGNTTNILASGSAYLWAARLDIPRADQNFHYNAVSLVNFDAEVQLSSGNSIAFFW
jgi:hypothetical protein